MHLKLIHVTALKPGGTIDVQYWKVTVIEYCWLFKIKQGTETNNYQSDHIKVLGMSIQHFGSEDGKKPFGLIVLPISFINFLFNSESFPFEQCYICAFCLMVPARRGHGPDVGDP